jgi:hypothetical protein
MREITVDDFNEKVPDAARRLRALDLWAKEFAGTFPAKPAKQPFVHWKIPILDRLANPPTTTPTIQARCAQCLIDAATHLAEAKPGTLAKARVTAIISLPNLFASEVCIFFDEDYFESFTDRTAEWQRWTLLPAERNLLTEMNLRAPEDFFLIGFSEVIRDEEDDGVYEGEVWLVGECGPAGEATRR